MTGMRVLYRNTIENHIRTVVQALNMQDGSMEHMCKGEWYVSLLSITNSGQLSVSPILCSAKLSK